MDQNIRFSIPISMNKTLSEMKRKERIIKTQTEEGILKQWPEVVLTVQKSKGYQYVQYYVDKHLLFIIDKALDKEARAVSIFYSNDFLIAMEYNHTELDHEYTVKFNSLYIDYKENVAKGIEKYDLYTETLLMNNAIIVNRLKINSLVNLGLEEKEAAWLVVNRYCTFSNRIGIIRLTRAIQLSSISIMDEQMIVDIYSKLCSDCATDLFCGVMEDRYTKEQFDTDSEYFIYQRVAIAILEILEKGVSSYDIEKIIMRYINEISKTKRKGRFSLNSINDIDYPRINSVLDNLKSKGINIL